MLTRSSGTLAYRTSDNILVVPQSTTQQIRTIVGGYPLKQRIRCLENVEFSAWRNVVPP